MLSPRPTSLAPDGQPWRISVLRNRNGVVATFMDWGATWLSARIPLPDGSVREALLGGASPDAWLRQSAYLGATVGRYANRIAAARLNRTGQQLVANQGENQLHGGPEGFDKRRWQILEQSEQHVRYRLYSPDGDQGFPGNVVAEIGFTLGDDNALDIRWQAQSDQPSPVNLTNHAYFNLDAHHGDAREHRLQLDADRYLPVDADGLPQEGLRSVANSGFDFRQLKAIATDFLRDAEQQRVKGYDHAFLLNAAGSLAQPVARLAAADGRLTLAVYTDAPALQLYTGNWLHGTPNRTGGEYADYAGIALESGWLADSPNHPEWPQPDCWLQPGETRHATTRYHFLAE
ncbi:galactose-1-epimerase [Pantoea sp. 1.19]|uniref:galactose-1-epimerase n=1 Tax=Pantoea sp. 1.19 TaxID=1925589 RepID=UPI000948A124|nr:galactose-1-epimerase [Pantoea sp. 1.19]